MTPTTMAVVGGGALLVVLIVVAGVWWSNNNNKGGGGGDAGKHGGGKWKDVDCNACPADVDPTWQPCGFANRCQAMCAPGDKAAKKAAFECHRRLDPKAGKRGPGGPGGAPPMP